MALLNLDKENGATTQAAPGPDTTQPIDPNDPVHTPPDYDGAPPPVDNGEVVGTIDPPADVTSSTTATQPNIESDWTPDQNIDEMGGDPEVDYYTGNYLGIPNIPDDPNAKAVTREVQDNELVATHMTNLLNSNSKYMQDARRQGLEQANAMGGLGGTAAAGASMQAALRAGLPIAQQDAATFAATASENMQALNEFGKLNHQRATQLALGQMDSNTRIMTSNIAASASIAQQKLQNAAQRDIAWLDSQTKQKITQMQGAIQARLAKNQFEYNKVLTDMENANRLQQTQMQGEYGLAGTALQGQWQLENTNAINAANREANYTQQATGVYASMMDRIAALNGMEMDDAARNAAIQTIIKSGKAEYDIVNTLYPDMPPLEFDWPDF